jgi:hypothetical protein
MSAVKLLEDRFDKPRRAAKAFTVRIILENVLATIAAIHDIVDCSRRLGCGTRCRSGNNGLVSIV